MQQPNDESKCKNWDKSGTKSTKDNVLHRFGHNGMMKQISTYYHKSRHMKAINQLKCPIVIECPKRKIFLTTCILDSVSKQYQ